MAQAKIAFITALKGIGSIDENGTLTLTQENIESFMSRRRKTSRAKKDGTKRVVTPSAFRLFLQENIAQIKEENPESCQGRGTLLKKVGEIWSKFKEDNDPVVEKYEKLAKEYKDGKVSQTETTIIEEKTSNEIEVVVKETKQEVVEGEAVNKVLRPVLTVCVDKEDIVVGAVDTVEDEPVVSGIEELVEKKPFSSYKDYKPKKISSTGDAVKDAKMNIEKKKQYENEISEAIERTKKEKKVVKPKKEKKTVKPKKEKKEKKAVEEEKPKKKYGQFSEREVPK